MIWDNVAVTIALKDNSGESMCVVIPVLNEQDGLAALISRLRPVLERTGLTWSILFVDDGSTDRTLAQLRRLNNDDPRITAIALSRNFGKEIAVAAGLRHAQGDAVVIMDADLQHPPETIPAFITKWREGHDVVYGKRTDRDADSAWRRVGARGFYAIFYALSGTPLQEDSGDFRLLSRRAVDAINDIGERVRYNNGLFAWIGYPSVGVPFDFPPRAGGETSRWQALKLAHLAIDGLATFSTAPLKISALLGFFLSVVAFAYMAVVLFHTLVFGSDVRGFPALMVVILFFSGIQLIFLGILGAYLGRVYEEVKARPLYLVRDTIGVAPDRSAAQPKAVVPTPTA
ncbi:MAG: glycosyltransferase family 2 protein [Hyphomicrobium sp.]